MEAPTMRRGKNLALSPRRIREALIIQKRGDFSDILSQSEEWCLKEYGFSSLAEFLIAKVSDNGIGMTPSVAKSTLLAYGKLSKDDADFLRRQALAERARSIPAAKPHGGRRKAKAEEINQEQPANTKEASNLPTVDDMASTIAKGIKKSIQQAINTECAELNKRIEELESRSSYWKSRHDDLVSSISTLIKDQ